MLLPDLVRLAGVCGVVAAAEVRILAARPAPSRWPVLGVSEAMGALHVRRCTWASTEASKAVDPHEWTLCGRGDFCPVGPQARTSRCWGRRPCSASEDTSCRMGNGETFARLVPEDPQARTIRFAVREGLWRFLLLGIVTAKPNVTADELSAYQWNSEQTLGISMTRSSRVVSEDMVWRLAPSTTARFHSGKQKANCSGRCRWWFECLSASLRSFDWAPPIGEIPNWLLALRRPGWRSWRRRTCFQGLWCRWKPGSVPEGIVGPEERSKVELEGGERRGTELSASGWPGQRIWRRRMRFRGYRRRRGRGECCTSWQGVSRGECWLFKTYRWGRKTACRFIKMEG